ncbi:MAG: hypothetical protein IPL01_18660 [Acidobacteria bacterium]|jgi:hypothetical protein|nr:hypothetical protein [Acidobacteriota bacterium]MBK7598860.1 hypothetical protein [Acidobacteriota bacterium]MBK8315908.1 hypothetical protein [Acidobacteriota bacterium]
MEIESRVVASFDTEERRHYQGINTTDKKYTQIIKLISDSESQESSIDLLAASIVIGLTAQFVSFIFGWTTEYIPRLLDNLLLSSFMGLCVGVIAFAWMKDDK